MSEKYEQIKWSYFELESCYLSWKLHGSHLGGGQPFDWQNHQNIFFPPICRGGCNQWHILVWCEGHQFLSSEVNNNSLQKGGGFFICCKSTEQLHSNNSTRSSPSGDHLQLTSTEAIKFIRLLLLLSRGASKHGRKKSWKTDTWMINHGQWMTENKNCVKKWLHDSETPNLFLKCI